MNRLAVLLSLLLAPLAYAGPSAGPPQPPKATVETLAAGGCVAGDDRIFRVFCTSATDCAATGAVPQLVQCTGANTFSIIRDGAAGSGDGVPDGSGTEIQVRQSATEFNPVTGSSCSGANCSMSGEFDIGRLQLNGQGCLKDSTADGLFVDYDCDGSFDTGADRNIQNKTIRAVNTGSESAGLREALYKCPVTGGCTIELIPGTHYDLIGFTFGAVAGQREVLDVCDCVDNDNCEDNSDVAGECKDIYFVGAQGAEITLGTDPARCTAADLPFDCCTGAGAGAACDWHPDGTIGAVTFKQIFRFDNVDGYGMKDVRMTIWDMCNDTADSTCPDPMSEAFMIEVADNADHGFFRDNYFSSYESNSGSESGDDDVFNQWILIDISSGGETGQPDLQPRGVAIQDNIFHWSAIGIDFAHALPDDVGQVPRGYAAEPQGVTVVGNHFYSDLLLAGTDVPAKCAAMTINGNSAAVIGNEFNFEHATLSDGNRLCIAMSLEQGSPGDVTGSEDVGAGLIVSNNLITHLGRYQRAIMFSGVNGSIVSNNIVQAGACSLSLTKSCIEDGECGAGTCEPTTAVGIWFGGGVDRAQNSNNIVTGNSFGMGPNGDGGFDDDNTYGPIMFDDAAVITDPLYNTGNLIALNNWQLSDLSDDGFADAGSGDLAAAMARQQIFANGPGQGAVTFWSGITLKTAPTNDNASTQILARDATTGALEYIDSSTFGAASGDVSDVGDCTDGQCFTGSSGSTLTSTTSEILDLSSANILRFERNDNGSVTFKGADGTSDADTIYDTTGAGAIQIGSADVTAITISTDNTGDGTDVVLPAGAIGTTEILDSTIASADIAADTIVAADIATSAVDTAEILDGAIVTADIATGGVATADILDATILTGDIATDTILAGNIATSAVATAEILDATIIAGDIADDAITEAKLKAVDSPADEECLEYEATTGDFEWEACASGGDIALVGDCSTGDCFEGTGAEDELFATGDLVIEIDSDDDGAGTNVFEIEDGDDVAILSMTEAGVLTMIAGGEIVIQAHPTTGQCWHVKEGADDGTDIAEFCAPDSGLTTTVSRDMDANGEFDAETLIQDDSIDAGHLEASSVATSEILDSTILTGDIANDTILAGDIATSAVATAEILDATIAAADIANDTITATQIATSGVATAEILDATILTGDIAADTILAGNLATNSVGAAEVATDAIAAATDIATTLCTANQVLKKNAGNTAWACDEDDDAGGAPPLSSVTAPAADASFTFDDNEEFTLSFTGNYDQDQVIIIQQTGNPTAGSLVHVEVADASTSPVMEIHNSAAVTVGVGLEIAPTNASGVFTTALDLSDTDNVAAINIGDNTFLAASTTITAANLATLATGFAGIGDATGTGTIDFGGNDQDLTSSEDNGEILTITNTDADQGNDAVILRLATNDATGDANIIFLRGTADEDGTPTTEFNLASTATSGAVTMTLGSTGVVVSTDGDGAITFLGQSAGSDEAITLNLDDVSDEATFSSTTSVTTFNFPDGSISTADLKTEVRSMYWPAAAMSSDGTQCANPTEVTINSGVKMYTVICTDNDASTVYGSTQMPDGWDGGTVVFTLDSVQTAANTGVMNSDVTCQARGHGETANNTWGTEIAVDDAAVTGSNGVDQITASAATCDCTTSCQPGDTLFWRLQLDAGGFTTTAASWNILGMRMEYTTNVGD